MSEESKYNLGDSAVEAFSLGNLLKRLLLFLVFGVLLALKELVGNLDAWGRAGGGAWGFISALGSAMWAGVGKALGSMWVVILNPNLYIETHSWGSIGFSIFSMIMLVAFFYQPVAFFMNILDGKRGHATGVLLRIVITALLVLILSAITFYTVGAETITTNLVNNTAPVVENLTASVDPTNTSQVINLL